MKVARTRFFTERACYTAKTRLNASARAHMRTSAARFVALTPVAPRANYTINRAGMVIAIARFPLMWTNSTAISCMSQNIAERAKNF